LHEAQIEGDIAAMGDHLAASLYKLLQSFERPS